jgi:hypothetical protein
MEGVPDHLELYVQWAGQNCNLRAAHHTVEDSHSSAITVEEARGYPEAAEEQERMMAALKP